MKKIITPGKIEDTTRRFSCVACGCVFEADKDEYNTIFDRNELYHWSLCPECGHISYASNET